MHDEPHAAPDTAEARSLRSRDGALALVLLAAITGVALAGIAWG